MTSMKLNKKKLPTKTNFRGIWLYITQFHNFGKFRIVKLENYNLKLTNFPIKNE